MSGDTVQFYFYEIYAKNKEGNINLEEAIKPLDWNECCTKNPIHVLSGSIHEISIEQIKEKYFFGRIIRSKGKDGFFGKDTGELPEELDTEFEKIGEKGRDIVNFAFMTYDGKLIFLMEVGFQTAGMGIIKNFFEKTIGNGIEIDYKPLVSNKTSYVLTLIGKKLKTLVIQFRKNAEIPEKCKQAEDTLKQIISPALYSIKIEASVLRSGKKTLDLIPTLENGVKNLLGMSLKEAIDAGIDFPAFLSNFKIEVLDDNNQTLEEDILDKYERTQLKWNKNDLSEHDKLKLHLCKLIADKLNEEF